VKRFGTEVPCRLEERACRIASVRLEDFSTTFSIEKIQSGPFVHRPTLIGHEVPTWSLIAGLLGIAFIELSMLTEFAAGDWWFASLEGAGLIAGCWIIARLLLERAIPKNGASQIPHSFTGGNKR